MLPFDQLVLYLDEHRGRSDLGTLSRSVQMRHGRGETKAFAIRAQEAGVAEYTDGPGGQQKISLTRKGRERVAQIKAEMVAAGDPRLDDEWWRDQFGRHSYAPPLSELLFDKPKSRGRW